VGDRDCNGDLSDWLIKQRSLNPAVTIASAAWARFPKRLVLPYIIVQLIGAFAAAALLYAVFGGAIAAYESKRGIVRGAQGSEATAMVFGEYFPNPGGKPLTENDRSTMTPGRAFAAEVIGTAILLLVIFCSTDERNRHPSANSDRRNYWSNCYHPYLVAWSPNDGLP
jgi:glycerol uptake facilitator protein